MLDKIKEKFQDLYWLIPYDYRLENIWYRLRSRFWNKYTTIKSRELGHTYCDTVSLLPYTIFEVFVRFVENELKKDTWIDWVSHKVEWKGKELPVDTIWYECYDWWNNYLKETESLYNKWHEFVKLHKKDDFLPIPNSEHIEWGDRWDSEENRIMGHTLWKRAWDREVELEKELEEWLIFLVKTRNLMWT